MTLDVLIATFMPEGIRRVERMDLPRMDGVRYIVSWQMHDDVPVPEYFSDRDDIEIHRLNIEGVSNNRNNAIEHSTADIMLIADDDLVYTTAQLTAVINAFERRPDMEMGTFMYESEVLKTYPDNECDLSEYPKGFYASAIEIAVRRNSRAGRLRFSPDFGPGATRWTVGEDSMFLLTARRMGIVPRFIPEVICRHDGPTTGLRAMTDPKALRGTGACIALEYPFSSILRIPLKAWRGYRAGKMRLLPALWHMYAGGFEATFLYTPAWKK